MKHTIAIDCRFAAKHAGLGRYTRELVSALLARNDPWEYVLFVQDTHEPWIAALPKKPLLIPAPFSHYSLAEQKQFPSLLKQSGASLLFVPHFNAPLLSPIPFVITVHDLILHRFPNNASFLKRAAYRLQMRLAIKKAKAVVTVSNFVEQELKTEYGALIAQKLHVTHEGVGPQFAPRSATEVDDVRRKNGITAPYFLYVGNAKQHKNVQMLLDAFEQAKLPGQELILVTGGKEAEQLKLPSGARFLTHVSDEDLPALYTGAVACVTASLYEGFCLPVIEALACGCPVIAADEGPLREVTKGHAMVIEPKIEAFAHAFNNPPKERIPKVLWSWGEAAEKTAMVLRDVLDEK